MGDQKRADPETNLEVDIMILDYLLYMAAKAVMAQRRADLQGTEVDEGERPDLALSMVQCTLGPSSPAISSTLSPRHAISSKSVELHLRLAC